GAARRIFLAGAEAVRFMRDLGEEMRGPQGGIDLVAPERLLDRAGERVDDPRLLGPLAPADPRHHRLERFPVDDEHKASLAEQVARMRLYRKRTAKPKRQKGGGP